MRFRKKNKYRPAVHQSLALDGDDGGAAAERNERIAAQSRNNVRVRKKEESPDPGQELLGALGDFQQHLNVGRTRGTHGAWRDDTMAHLVTGYRVAKRRGWDELAQALADTGRILQTFVNSGSAKDALPLLQSSYQTLCLLVGDRMAGQDGDALREQWQQHYQEALMAIKAAGLSLAHDRDEGGQQHSKVQNAAQNRRNEPELTVVDDWNEEEELEVLEELPPLESLLETGLDSRSDSGAEIEYADETDDVEDATEESMGKNGADLAEWVEQESEDEADDAPRGPVLERVSIIEDDAYVDEVEAPKVKQPSAPPKIVVDILDRLCDQLRSVENTTGEERTLHLERFAGAISVLKREAEKNGYAAACDVCAAMEDMCVLAQAAEGALHDRFVELSYAFGGIFMEAHEEGETKVVLNWKIEAGLLVENWETEPAVEEIEAESTEEIGVAVAPVEAPTPAPVKQDAPKVEIPKQEAPQQEAPKQETPTREEPKAGAPVTAAAQPVAEMPALSPTRAPRIKIQLPVDDSSTSFELLEYAQKAAAAGDGSSAKFLALRAAARFAHDETRRAEEFLSNTEAKLRKSMESTEAAREQVKSAEEGVMKAATEVADGESTLGAMQERRAKVAQHLEEVQNTCARIEEEIRALQEKLALENQKAQQTKQHLEQSKEQERNAESVLSQLQTNEENARLNLEKQRQEVKDHQRSTLEIEAEMHTARDYLTQQRASLMDIQQTIEQISGNEHRHAEKADAMLF